MLSWFKHEIGGKEMLYIRAAYFKWDTTFKKIIHIALPISSIKKVLGLN